MVSEYYHVRRLEGHHLHKESHDLSLIDFTRLYRMDNAQSRFVLGHDHIIAESYEGELDFQKILNCLSKFEVIGLQDELQESINRIFKKIGVENVPEHVSFKYGHTPFTDENIKSISPSIIQEIEDLNQFDIELYEYASKNFGRSQNEPNDD